jgi:transitional endoplasmic reticulum ATPase
MKKIIKQIQMVPLCPMDTFTDLLMFPDKEDMTLREFLTRAPALSLEPVEEKFLDFRLNQFSIKPRQEPLNSPLYRPFDAMISADLSQNISDQKETEEKDSQKTEPHPDIKTADDIDIAEAPVKQTADFPPFITDETAVRTAYADEISNVASFLRAGLPVLVMCDKLVVEYLWRAMAAEAHLTPQLLSVPTEEEGGLMPRSLRQRQLAVLKKIIHDLKVGDVLIIPHLDLLAGGGDSNLPTESREIIELVYENSDRLVLAFADRSMTLPEVLSSRFAVRLLISGVPRLVACEGNSQKPIGKALVAKDEAALFQGFDPEGLYKNVAGMNPVRLRHAIKYAVREYAADKAVPVSKLYAAIRTFKVQTSSNFEVPNVTFDDIGGYEYVKAELMRALNLMMGSYKLPNEKLRSELIPRGFIFHGPPGTGKTLFAKAVANMLNATIQVVSGPEVTDMYVGESERKVRELFAEARRNAPAVLVFDEFDAIATQRSGREDGGSRAGNAIVAQILTEMDGFRPEVPMLVIGTTNRLDIIDSALLRPSRFKSVGVDLPDRTARQAIATVHARHFDIDISQGLIEVIASATEGFNGDEIRSLFRDACVGQHCENRPPVPQEFGRLVGALRQSAEQRQATIASHRRSAMQTTTRQDERPGATGTMYSLAGDSDENQTDNGG